MARILLFICFIAASGYIMVLGIEIIPERARVVSYNPKYIEYMNVSTGRAARRAPYSYSLFVRLLLPTANNVTLSMQLLELMSRGQYQPTPLKVSFRLCEFLDSEPYMGKLFKQLYNVSCPFLPGDYYYKNVIPVLQDFPYHLPFAWEHQVTTHTRADVFLSVTDTKESLYTFSVFLTITQKPKIKKL